VSARIDENGAKTEKLWLKHGSRDLTAKNLKDQGLKHKRKGIFVNSFELRRTAG